MSSRVRGEAAPPGAVVTPEVLSVPKEGLIEVVILGRIRGILTHWKPGKNFACPGVEVCESKVHRGETRWKGYVAAELYRGEPYDDWCPVVFEVTERLYDLMGAGDHRGEIWACQRQIGVAGVKEVRGELVGHIAEDLLREAFSVERAVYTVYKTVHVKWDVQPILPPRLILEPSKMPKPPLSAAEAERKEYTEADYQRVRKEFAKQGGFRKALEERLARSSQDRGEETNGEPCPVEPGARSARPTRSR